MNTSNQSEHINIFLQKEWKKFVLKQGKISIFGGILIFALAFFLTGLRLDLLGKFALIGLLAAFAIFLILIIFETLPNYVFFKKNMRDGKEEFLAKNIKQYGMSKLTHSMWFIWPRDLGGVAEKGSESV